MRQVSLDARYTIKEDGTVLGVRGSPLKPYVRSDGYCVVKLGDKMKFVHRLVAEAFIPNPDNKPEVNHIDGVKANNVPGNLEWCSRSHNMKHAHDTGLAPSGADRVLSKLTAEDVAEIRRSYENNYWGWTRATAKKYGVAHSAISRIVSGQLYQNER